MITYDLERPLLFPPKIPLPMRMRLVPRECMRAHLLTFLRQDRRRFFDRDIAKMNLALALFWIGALHLSAVSSSLLYRTIRDDENGRDGGSASDSDEPSALDAAPSLAPLVPLRFSFLTTDGGAGEGLRYSDYSIPALELAVEHVNANSRILPRFNISYDLKQLEYSTEAGLDAFFQDVFSRDSIIAFLDFS